MNHLYVLMGYPGCGKSYLAKQLAINDNDLYLSSDELREELYGFRDQDHNKELFAELFKRALDHKDVGDTYIDSTNLNRKDRARLISQFKGKYELDLICVLRPIDEIVEVNDRRQGEEQLPEPVFKRVLGKFQLPTYDEGWDDIQFYLVHTKFSPVENFLDYHNLEDIDHDNPHHNETLKEHLDYITKVAKATGTNKYIMHIAPYHDIGKFFVKQFNPEKGYSQFIGHAAVSAYVYLVNVLVNHMYAEHVTDNWIIGAYDLIGSYDFITEYYGIFYHDLPYTLPDREDMVHSLSKSSKPIAYMYKHFCKDKNGVAKLADIILEFNKIDRMREGEVDER